jgi:hypothetical protein
MDQETDGAVFQTVLDDMIRPEASRRRPATPDSLIAYDRTVPICSIRLVVNRLGCIRIWDLQALGNPASPPGVLMFEGLVTPIQRARLVGAFWNRNEVSHPLPVGAISGVTIAAPGGRESQPTHLDFARGIVNFSAPAYGGDGQALVYADYRCGEVCGYGWFVLLERRTGGWHVKGHRGLWVS